MAEMTPEERRAAAEEYRRTGNRPSPADPPTERTDVRIETSEFQRAQKWAASNWLKLSLLVCVLLVSASICYHFLVGLPRARQQEAERARLSEAISRVRLQRCLEDAQANYDARWKKTCLDLGRPEDCMLSTSLSDAYSRDRRDARDECLKRFDAR